jgi:hypothetical protein
VARLLHGTCRLLLIILGASLLTGCLHSSPGPLDPALIASLTTLVKLLKDELKLWFDEGDIPEAEIGDAGITRRHKVKMLTDRHKGFFVYRRAMVHRVTHPEWFAESDLGSLRQRIKEELTEVENFVQSKLTGPKSLTLAAPDGPSGAGPDEAFRTAADKHIDIENVTRVYTTRPARRDRQIQFQQFREDTARSIIWRAAAIHGGPDGTLLPEDHWSLWDNTKGPGQRLNQRETTAILDRRLRLVERMRFQINYVPAPNMGLTRAPGGGPTGPWQDFVRVQLFQYPFLGRNQDFLIQPINPDQWITQQDEFQWQFRPVSNQPRRIPSKLDPEPTSVSTIWVPSSENYAYVRTFSGPNLANAMDSLMASTLDYFKRGWLYCDQVCCALHVDSLRFGLLRKNTDADAQFNTIPAPTKKVRLEFPLGEAAADTNRPNTFPRNTLFANGHGQSAQWFENRFIQIHHLQTGDHTIFYNHYVYVALWSGAFRLENAIVTEVDSNPWPEKSGVEHLRIKLEGHGMVRRDVAGFQNDMLSSINESGERGVGGLPRARRDAVQAATEGLEAFINWRDFRLIKWDPYPGITSAPGVAGPWFLYLPRIDPFGLERWPDLPRMLAAVAYSVRNDPNPSAGYRGDPLPVTKQGRRLVTPGQPVPALGPVDFPADGVLFPLYLPNADGTLFTWPEYFERRRSNPSLQVVLRTYHAPRTIIPGFFIAGQTPLPAQVIRPKAQV